MSRNQPEQENKETLKQKVIDRAKKGAIILVAALVVLWSVPRFVSWIAGELTDPITEPIGKVVQGIGNVVDQGAENLVETVMDPIVRTRSYELTYVDVVGDLVYDPIECPALASVTVQATLVETHGRAIFFTDSDTFSASVPVKVRPCLYLDAVSESMDGKTVIVDLSKMHFEPDPEAVLFMSEYLKNDNPGNESGVERLVESGWMAPFFGIFQGLMQDPERTEISGLLIAIGESAAANSVCIEAMMEGVREYTVPFYQEQAARQGRDVQVKLVGKPDLYQNDHLLEMLLQAIADSDIEIDVAFRDIPNTCDISFEHN